MEGVRELLAAIDSFRTRVFSWIINGGHAVDIKAVEDGSDFDAHFADEEDDDNCCSICTEPMTTDGDILRLPCNDKHAFHLACIREWAGVNLSCPLDRKPIPPEVLVQLSPFNSVRLHASIFLEAMLSGTVQYLQYTHIWFDFPVNFISMAVNKCSTAWVRQIERSLYTHEELPHEDGVDGEARRVMLLPEFLRPAVRLTSKVTFHALLWTAYSSIGYTSIVLHYLVRQIVEQQGHRICMQAIGLANVGYDYAGTKPLLAKTQLASFLKGIGFLLGLVVVGRQVRRCSHDLASHVLGQLHQALSVRA